MNEEWPTLQKVKQKTGGFSTFVLTWYKRKQNRKGRFVLNHAKSKWKTTFLVFIFSISLDFMNERRVHNLAITEKKNKLFFDCCFNRIKTKTKNRRLICFISYQNKTKKGFFQFLFLYEQKMDGLFCLLVSALDLENFELRKFWNLNLKTLLELGNFENGNGFCKHHYVLLLPSQCFMCETLKFLKLHHKHFKW